MNRAFSTEPDPSPALLTDGQQMAFCVQREREIETGEKGRGDIHRGGGGGCPEVF